MIRWLVARSLSWLVLSPGVELPKVLQVISLACCRYTSYAVVGCMYDDIQTIDCRGVATICQEHSGVVLPALLRTRNLAI